MTVPGPIALPPPFAAIPPESFESMRLPLTVFGPETSCTPTSSLVLIRLWVRTLPVEPFNMRTPWPFVVEKGVPFVSVPMKLPLTVLLSPPKSRTPTSPPAPAITFAPAPRVPIVLLSAPAVELNTGVSRVHRRLTRVGADQVPLDGDAGRAADQIPPGQTRRSRYRAPGDGTADRRARAAAARRCPLMPEPMKPSPSGVVPM